MPPADLAIVGASIRTLDPAQPRASAVAVRDGIVIAVGGDAEVREHAGAATELIDGRAIGLVPRLVDSHIHQRGRRWRAGAAKLFIDGVIDTGTAWLIEPGPHGEGTEPFWPDPGRYAEGVAASMRGALRRPDQRRHARRPDRPRCRPRRVPARRAARRARSTHGRRRRDRVQGLSRG